MTHPIDLYRLLPAAHQREDAELGFPLEALLDIISTEVGHVQRNITDLWDDFFIETSAEWVVPYIAELVGTTSLHQVAGSRRADVANTIGFRRRKGTVSMLEDLAADVTGWGARVVDLFELLGWTQHLDHLRRQPSGNHGRSTRVGTVDVGDIDALDLLDGPFDRVAHTVDIRPFGAGRGRHNLRKIGFFLWRLQSHPLSDVDARQHPDEPHGYRFSPLGNDAPLYTNIDAPRGSGRRSESDLPGPVRGLALHADLDRGPDAEGPRRYYGSEPGHSCAVAIGDPTAGFVLVDADEVAVSDLCDWQRPPDGKTVAIDPERGRLTLAEQPEPADRRTVRVSFSYGFSGGAGGDLGGGPYDRRDSMSEPPATVFEAEVARHAPPQPGLYPSIERAIGEWVDQEDRPARAVIEIADNATYTEGDLRVAIPEDGSLELRAANGRRPVLDVGVLAPEGAGQGNARFVVNGCAILGGPVRIGQGLSAIEIRHCTLVPGRAFDPDGEVTSAGEPSLLADDAVTDCRVTVTRSILGPIRLRAEPFTLTVADSVVDAVGSGAPDRDTTAIAGPEQEPGPNSDLRRVTVLGDVRVRSLAYASEVIFGGTVQVERTQIGCLRFSWVPPEATTPRRYRCQPDVALERIPGPAAQTRAESRLRPRFTSVQYGQPGYAQLAADAPPELRTGGADGSQMGAFNRLREPQRETNLRLRLDEYLPAGLEPGLIYVT